MKRNSIIALIMAAALLFAVFASPVIAANESITVKEINAKVTSRTTLYAGEVILDGQSVMKYLYSDDITLSKTVFGSVKDCLSASDKSEFAELVPELDDTVTGGGFVSCSDDGYAVYAGEKWKDAENVGAALYPDKAVVSSAKSDLFEEDARFAAACSDGWGENVSFTDENDAPFAICGPLGALTVSATDNVTYTVEDGVLVKIIDRVYDYTCESVTVVYTNVELKSSNEKSKENIVVFSYQKSSEGTEVLPDGVTASDYTAAKASELMLDLSKNMPECDRAVTVGYADLFTENSYAVYERMEFQGISYKSSDDAIFIGDLDDFDNAYVVSGSVVREQHYTVYYKLVTVTEKEPEPEFMPGDINGDRSVDNKDVAALFRYLNGHTITVVEAALDCSGDGELNNKDVAILFRYISGGYGTVLSDKAYKK